MATAKPPQKKKKKPRFRHFQKFRFCLECGDVDCDHWELWGFYKSKSILWSPGYPGKKVYKFHSYNAPHGTNMSAMSIQSKDKHEQFHISPLGNWISM